MIRPWGWAGSKRVSEVRQDPVAIIGAGPTGIEAALACVERDVSFRLFEAGPSAASGIAEWGGVRLFTPWGMNLSPRMDGALRALGVDTPDAEACPTGREFIEHALAPIAGLPAIVRSSEYGARVRHIAREGLSKDHEIGTPLRAGRAFRLTVRSGGRDRIARASAVIDCSGGRAVPNWTGDGGVPALGEEELDERISREIPDVSDARWRGAHTLLVGAGHSAQTAARDLASLAAEFPGTRVTWAVRSAEPDWGSPHDDPLPERAALSRSADLIASGGAAVDFRSGVVVEELAQDARGIQAVLRNGAGREELRVDQVLALTGRVGDHAMYRQLQVHECYATSGPMNLAATLMQAGGDCLAQPNAGIDVLANPEPGFFILGAKSYGRNSRYLLQVGYRQVDEVVKQALV